KLREELPPEALTPESLTARADFGPARDVEGRLKLGRKDPRYWPAVGVVLDVLAALGGRGGEAAAAPGVGTGDLIDFLQSDDKVWEQANHLRARFGHKALH